MGLFDFLKTKASAASATFVTNPGQPRWTPRNYASFAKEGYMMNVVAFQSINRVADAIATVEWEIWNGDKMVEGAHPLKVLWDRPNPAQSNSEFLRAAVGFLLLSGNGYIEAAEGNRARPTELYALRSDRMKVVPNSEGQVESFIYTHNSRKVRWEVDPITGRGPILHMKMFNPLDDFYGMSPIEAGAFALDQHNESMKWMQALIQNSAKPSGALVMKEGLTMGDEQFARLQATIEANHSGAANAGRPMLLENGLDWKQMGLSPTDMGILETKYSAARDVALAFGVPPQLLGIPGDATYSNYKEARLAFYEDTVLPLLNHLLGALNPWFEEPFNGAKIVPNLDSIPAIADKRQEKWDMVDKSRELTLNERREAKGYPPIETVVPGENGNRLLNLDRAEAGVNTPDGKALLARLAYGS